VYRDTSQELDEHDRAVGAILIGEAIIDDCDRAFIRARDHHEAPQQERWRAIADVHDAYPEIWRHLDRARRVLANRGANTAAYDELRPHARRAAVDPGLDGERALDSAAFDDARRALEELKLAVPGADWDAIAARTQGLVRAPLVARKRRQRLAVAGVIGVFAIAVTGWLFAIIPEHRQSRREAMRDELRVVDQQRKLKIVALEGGLGARCAPDEAHELMRLLVLDGRGLDARAFATDYTSRCGTDSVIDHWAHAPLPRR
jgi:hypothetical protein